MVYITLMAPLGEGSHCNRTSVVTALLYSLMGAQRVLVAAVLYAGLTVATFVQAVHGRPFA